MSRVLLINLGSPSTPDIKDVRRYLKEFLSDDEVIDLPKPIQQFILHAFILPFRPKRSKAAYERIWTQEGSPLVNNTQKIADALCRKTGWTVDIAMRYQQPSMRTAIRNIVKDGVKEIVVVPLYPHNAMATIGTTRKELNRIVAQVDSNLKVYFAEPFFDHNAYIDALVASIRPHITSTTDILMFSYHGLPERHLLKADVTGCHCMKVTECCSSECSSMRACYRANVLKSSSLAAKSLGLPNGKWRVSFQSRVSAIGPKWLSPYTNRELDLHPRVGLNNVVIVCPSFVCDCLETLWEIDIEGREIFRRAGGGPFTYVPSLNASPDFINCLEEVVLDARNVGSYEPK